MDKSTFLINMGRRIAKARKDVGLSQASLAEKADISEIHMSNIERGKKNPSADVLCRISEILNISVDVIFVIVTFKIKLHLRFSLTNSYYN